MDQSKQPGIQIDQIFLAEAYFAHGSTALSLPADYRIEALALQIQTKFVGKPGDRAALVGARLETTDPDAVYKIIVDMVMGVSAISGQENLDPLEYVTRMGPATLYPFVREAVASLTWKGRFGPLWLKPYNFTAATTVVAETHEIGVSPQPASTDS